MDNKNIEGTCGFPSPGEACPCDTCGFNADFVCLCLEAAQEVKKDA